MSTIEITDELEAEEPITPAVEETPSPLRGGYPHRGGNPLPHLCACF